VETDHYIRYCQYPRGLEALVLGVVNFNLSFIRDSVRCRFRREYFHTSSKRYKILPQFWLGFYSRLSLETSHKLVNSKQVSSVSSTFGFLGTKCVCSLINPIWDCHRPTGFIRWCFRKWLQFIPVLSRYICILTIVSWKNVQPSF
jgi:hypothetical protein